MPVAAELAVAVADEGVLQIAGYKTPDPMKKFYAPHNLAVEASTTWNRIARHHAPDEGEPEEGGDGGGDEAGRIRSRFVATAFWAPAVLTKDDGTAVVTFTAPDNLTAFRVMAVAADLGDRFGSSEQRFTVAKPLLAMPALPRFLNVGDHARAGALVLLGDPGRSYLPREGLDEIARYTVRTIDDIEGQEELTAFVYRLHALR